MRRIGSVLLVLAGAALFFAEARGQGTFPPTGQQAAQFINGVDSSKITSTKIDTSRALRPPGVNGAFHTPSMSGASPLGNVFPKISLGSWPPRLANVSILKGKNPFQPNPIRGKNPFDLSKKK